MTTIETIRQHLTDEYLVDHPDVELSDDLDLLEADVLDSLGILTLVDFLESTFGIAVEPEDVTLDNFETVRAIADLVASKRDGRA